MIIYVCSLKCNHHPDWGSEHSQDPFPDSAPHCEVAETLASVVTDQLCPCLNLLWVASFMWFCVWLLTQHGVWGTSLLCATSALLVCFPVSPGGEHHCLSILLVGIWNASNFWLFCWNLPLTLICVPSCGSLHSCFILLQVVDQFSQHHLLKRLSFFHCISLPPLSKIT